MNAFRLRPATTADIADLRRLMRDTIASINARDYDNDQTTAWAAAADRDETFVHRIQHQLFLVAEISTPEISTSTIVGFGSIELPPLPTCVRCVVVPPAAHLDLLYVQRDFQRCGIGRALMTALVTFAAQQGLRRVTANVSLTARPLFERAGFRLVAQQWPVVGGVAMPNLRMECSGSAGPPVDGL